MKKKSCPVCNKNLYYNFDLKQWEHNPIQKQSRIGYEKVCKYVLKQNLSLES
jgi:hypothetical protein